jgi:hypothetical protein
MGFDDSLKSDEFGNDRSSTQRPQDSEERLMNVTVGLLLPLEWLLCTLASARPHLERLLRPLLKWRGCRRAHPESLGELA